MSDFRLGDLIQAIDENKEAMNVQLTGSNALTQSGLGLGWTPFSYHLLGNRRFLGGLRGSSLSANTEYELIDVSGYCKLGAIYFTDPADNLHFNLRANDKTLIRTASYGDTSSLNNVPVMAGILSIKDIFDGGNGEFGMFFKQGNVFGITGKEFEPFESMEFKVENTKDSNVSAGVSVFYSVLGSPHIEAVGDNLTADELRESLGSKELFTVIRSQKETEQKEIVDHFTIHYRNNDVAYVKQKVNEIGLELIKEPS